MFKIGDTVKVVGNAVYLDTVPGTVVFIDDATGKYLVRFGASQQDYFEENELQSWL